MLSTGAVTAQFSIDEHIEMSLFTAEFLRHTGIHLQVLGQLTHFSHLNYEGLGIFRQSTPRHSFPPEKLPAFGNHRGTEENAAGQLETTSVGLFPKLLGSN